jgi:hypothetical protein
MSLFNALMYTLWVLPLTIVMLAVATVVHVLILDFTFLEESEVMLSELGHGLEDVWRAVFQRG